MRSALAEAQRAGKRQAAPFSKGRPKSRPRRAGRRPGRRYGPKAHRLPPAHVDEILQAKLPERCPHCDAAVGISITRGGLCLALHRVARAAEPTYLALRDQLRSGLEVITPDESGWKVGGELQWLWVAATATITVYAIQAGRGFDEAAAILGPDFAGTLARRLGALPPLREGAASDLPRPPLAALP